MPTSRHCLTHTLKVIVPRFILAVSVALTLTSAPADGQQAAQRLIGTWRLIEFCNVDSPGDTTYSLGRRPIGYFMYDAAGNVSIQAMRAAPSAAFNSDSIPLRGMAELRASYFGYFGTYTVTSDSTVVHHVRGGTIPSYIGTDQRRNFRFRGDTLSISADEPWGCRQLVREP
jgi:hypothetical protein